MSEYDLRFLKTGFPKKWNEITKNLSYPYEYFNSLDDYKKPADNLKKEYFFSKLENAYSDDQEKQTLKDIIK